MIKTRASLFLLLLLLSVSSCKPISEESANIYAQGTADSIMATYNAGYPAVTQSPAQTLTSFPTFVPVALATAQPQTNFVQSLKLPSCVEGETLAHAGSVNALALSQDGSILVSGGDDNAIKVWHLPDGSLMDTIAAHEGAVTALIFQPSTSILVSGSADRTIRFWDLATGENIQTLTGHAGAVTALTFTPDGTQLISGSEDTSVRRWGTPLETLMVSTLYSHNGKVNSLDMIGGGLIASASSDGTIQIWNLQERDTVRTIRKHNSAILAIDVRRDGRLLASGTEVGVLRLWNADSGDLVSEFEPIGEPITAVQFSPHGLSIGYASSSGGLWLVDIATGGQTLVGNHQATVKDLSFSQDSTALITAGEDGMIKFWPLSNAEGIETTPMCLIEAGSAE